MAPTWLGLTCLRGPSRSCSPTSRGPPGCYCRWAPRATRRRGQTTGRCSEGPLGGTALVEVDTQGDAFFFAFPDPQSAVDAAAEGQEALASGPVRVRMGIHTGTPHLTDEGYVGEAINKGARIAAAGHGGQVLLSKETRELTTGEVSDLGEHRLKDLAQPAWIFQLGRERFPALKSISNTNLPTCPSGVRVTTSFCFPTGGGRSISSFSQPHSLVVGCRVSHGPRIQPSGLPWVLLRRHLGKSWARIGAAPRSLEPPLRPSTCGLSRCAGWI